MTKQDLLTELTSKGEIGRNGRTPSWEKAFDLYNKTFKENMNPRCGGCFNKVRKWLQS